MVTGPKAKAPVTGLSVTGAVVVLGAGGVVDGSRGLAPVCRVASVLLSPSSHVVHVG